ncbi:hypothetical protein ACFL2R_03175 [Patescibacteria group bacterium]
MVQLVRAAVNSPQLFFEEGCEMKKHEELASRLKLYVDGKEMRSNGVNIFRKKKGSEQWVYLSVVLLDGGCDEYLIDRKNMVKSWLKLDRESKSEVSQMKVEINGEKWIAKGTSEIKIGDEVFVQLEIEKKGVVRVIAIDRVGLVEAYYALRTNVEDLAADIGEALAHIFKF